MNRWKVAFFTLLVVALCCLAFMTRIIIDDSFALAALDHYERQGKALTILRGLAPEIFALKHPVTHDELIALLQKQNPGILVTSGTSTIEIDQLRFHFAADNTLDRIEQTDDYGTKATQLPKNRDTIK